MDALILSGGQGTRLRPLTLHTPKPLLPIANVPFLSYQLALLRAHGTNNVTLCTSDILKPYAQLIKSEKTIGTAVFCSREQKELGTAGAIKNAEPFARTSSFFVFNGDVLTDMNLSNMIKFHLQKKSLLTIALVPMIDPSSYGLVITDSSKKIKKFIEKPDLKPNNKKKHLINSGIYLIDQEIFKLIPKGLKYSAERQLFPQCLKDNVPFYGFEIPASDYWLDIGTPQRYLQANTDVLKGTFSRSISQYRKNYGTANKIHRSAKIEKDVTLGNQCMIGANSILKNCVLLNNVTVENDVVLENCIIDNKCRIGHHSIVQTAKILGQSSLISPYSRL